MQLIKDFLDFTEYVYTFYNTENGIYPISTREQINKAIYIYITNPKNNKIDWDSMDREKVRTILENM
jgi:hypothetical protein